MIYSEELGTRLLTKRKRLGLTRERVAKDTGLSVEFIKAAEKGTLGEELDAYGIGKLRTYCTHLGVAIERPGKTAQDSAPRHRKLRVHKKVKAPIVTSSIAFQAVVVAVLGGLLGYIVWQVVAFAGNPQLQVDYPQQDQVVAHEDFEVVGSTSPGADVTIDGQSVLVADDGSFRLPVTLGEGVYTLRVEARNSFGRSTALERTVVVEPEGD